MPAPKFLPLLLALPVVLLMSGAAGAQDAAPESGSGSGQAAAAAAGAAAERPAMDAIEQAWAAGDFVFVRNGLKRHAEETGTALAQYRYGRVLLEGRGGPRDVPAARDWLEKAVAQTHAEAAVLLARLYLSGLPGGPERDPVRAADLLKGAAARGRAEAQYYLGLLYREGQGVAQDSGEAFTWLLAAAEGGHIAAQFELSRAYARGEGVAEDSARALHWMQEAAGAGHAEAQFFLAYALDSGQGAVRNRAAALDWLRRSAEGGFVQAQAALGRKYLKGDGADPDPEEARRWLQAAAGGGSLGALADLGEAYLGRYGGDPDPKRAQALLEQASAAGLARASYLLAELAEAGLPEDLDGAVALYRKAAEQGSSAAAQRLGELAGAGRLDGLLAPHRMVPWALAAAEAGDAQALAWLEARAADGLRDAQSGLGRWLAARQEQPEAVAALLLAAAQAGDVPAQHELGLLFIRGAGVEQDYVQAHKWLNIAAAGGHAAALEMRSVAADLMTREQVAEAQTAARAFFDGAVRQVSQ